MTFLELSEILRMIYSYYYIRDLSHDSHGNWYIFAPPECAMYNVQCGACVVLCPMVPAVSSNGRRLAAEESRRRRPG